MQPRMVLAGKTALPEWLGSRIEDTQKRPRHRHPQLAAPARMTEQSLAHLVSEQRHHL